MKIERQIDKTKGRKNDVKIYLCIVVDNFNTDYWNTI